MSVSQHGGTPKFLQIAEMGEPEGRAEVFTQLQPVLFGDGREDLDNLGVKLGSRAAVDLLSGMRKGQGFAIRAIADHRVERIGNGENAGAQGDVLTS